MSTPMFETPKHHPIEVNARGQGPAEPEETVAIVCWCGDRACTEFFKVIQEQRRTTEELHALTDRQSDLLTGVAAAVNGPPPPMTMWSHHDLPERVQLLREVALGRVRHRYVGDCPDFLEGWDASDPDCPACKALGGVE